MTISKIQDIIERRLRNSIINICQETISYENLLEIDGLISISLGANNQYIVVKIHEQLHKSSPVSTSAAYDFDQRKSGVIENYNATRIPKDDRGGFANDDDNVFDGISKSNSVKFDGIKIKQEADVTDDDITSDQPTPKWGLQRSELESTDSNADGKDYNRPTAATGEQDYTSLYIPTSDDSDNSFNRNNDSENIPVRLPICRTCDMTFDGFDDFDSHNYSIHSTYTCKYCLQAFTSRPNMLRHTRRHTGYKPFTCPVCDCRFSRKDDHNIHVLKHSVAKPFTCAMCSKDYTDRSCLRSHMKREHQRRLLYVCSQCGKGFGDRDSVDYHRLIHTGQRLYKCRRCTFVVNDENKLRDHETSHEKTGNLYHCTACDISFVSYDLYEAHMLNMKEEHATFPCLNCTRKFATATQFENHKCFNASELDKPQSAFDDQFSDNGLHNYTSDGNKIIAKSSKGEYWCTECSLGFSKETDFTQHISLSHCGTNHGQRHSDVPFIDLCATGRLRERDVSAANNDFIPGLPALTPTHQDSTATEEQKAMDLSLPSRRNVDTLIARLENPSQRVITASNYSDLEKTDKSANDITAASKPAIPSKFSQPLLSLLAVTERVPMLIPNIRERSATAPSFPFDSQQPKLKKRKCHSLPDDYGIINNNNNNNNLNNKQSMSSSISPGSFTDTYMSVFNGELSGSELPSHAATSPTEGFNVLLPPNNVFKMQENFRCDFCSEDFHEFQAFSAHCASAHKRYICDHCGMFFTAKPNRDRHRRYHTGERPYSCNLCHQTFFRGDDLKYHRTTKHVDVTPFQCQICCRAFSWSRDLEQHIQTHFTSNKPQADATGSSDKIALTDN